MKYSLGVAYILWALGGFGVLGLHRFYLGKVPTGVLWICTAGLGGIGCVYDFFTLGRQVDDANAKYAYRAGLAGPRTVYIREARPEPVKESIEKISLRLAKRNGGTVSPGEVALESDYGTEECRTALEAMTGKGLCEMRVRPSGVIVFRFPEFERGDVGFEPGL